MPYSMLRLLLCCLGLPLCFTALLRLGRNEIFVPLLGMWMGLVCLVSRVVGCFRVDFFKIWMMFIGHLHGGLDALAADAWGLLHLLASSS